MSTVTYSNPTDTYKMMYSDGPETLGNYDDIIDGKSVKKTSTVPCVLLAYKQNSAGDTDEKDAEEIAMPSHLELGLYHNNNLPSTTVIIGAIIYNKASSPITVSVRSNTEIAPSIDASSAKQKVKQTALNEADFNNSNYDTDENGASVSSYTIAAGAKNFVYKASFAYQQLINARISIDLSGNDCTKALIRLIAFDAAPYSGTTLNSTIANTIWNGTDDDEYYQDCATGQFSGVVNYSQKNVAVTLTNTGDSFEIFHTTDTKTDDNEFADALYHKIHGKDIFDGNFSIIYALDITHPTGSNQYLRITPYSTNTANTVATLTAKIGDGSWQPLNDGEPMVRIPSTSNWHKNYYIPLDSSGNTHVELILPGGNCGVLTCKLYNGSQTWYSSDESESRYAYMGKDVNYPLAYSETKTSDITIYEGDVIKVNYEYIIDIPSSIKTSSSNWEFNDDATVSICNEVESSLGVTVLCENGKISYKFNGTSSSSNTTYGSLSLTVGEDLDEHNLSLSTVLGAMAVSTNSSTYYLGATVNFEVYINDEQVVYY